MLKKNILYSIIILYTHEPRVLLSAGKNNWNLSSERDHRCRLGADNQTYLTFWISVIYISYFYSSEIWTNLFRNIWKLYFKIYKLHFYFGHGISLCLRCHRDFYIEHVFKTSNDLYSILFNKLLKYKLNTPAHAQ